MKTKTFYVISDSEFINLVNKTYNKNYNMYVSEGLITCTYQVFYVKKGNLDEEQLEQLEDFKQEGIEDFGLIDSLFRDLANKEIISEGNYLMEIEF